MSTEADPKPQASAELAELQRTLEQVAAPWVAALGLRLLAAGSGSVTMALPVAPQLVHSGGVLCGQALMAAADTAMILAISQQLGGFRPMTTVQLQTSFLRPVAGNSGEAQVMARVLRAGKNLVFGEIEIFNAKGDLAAHATTTYALL